MLQGTAERALGIACAWRLPRLVLLAGLSALAACSGPERPATVAHQPALTLPGETIVADDSLAQWRPYIREASQRYGVPEQWIREVIMQESAGQQYVDGQPITSPAGAMGLMQVMPGTYDILRQRYGLGPDPYDPHDNIMAGTAYIREMYDRYGSPGFLAAYNAGPGRLDQYLAGESKLPTETVNYVASVAPRLGNAAPATGPLAGYAVASVNMGGGYDPRFMRPPRETALVAGRPAPPGCDPFAAYDPNGPCGTGGGGAPVETGVAVAELAPAPASPAAPAPRPEPTLVAVALPPAAPAAAGKPAAPALVEIAKPLPAPEPAPLVVASKPAAPKPAAPAASATRLDQAVAFLSAPAPAKPAARAAAPAPRVQLASVPQVELAPVGRAGIQVGVFGNADAARAAAAKARLVGQSQLSGAQVQVAKTTPFGGNVYYMARLVGLTPGAAIDACKALARKSVRCQVVTPTQGS